MKINPLDVITEEYHVTGGSAWGTFKSGIKLTHIHTGITVKCHSRRSAYSNRARAWDELYAMIEGHGQMELFE